VAGGPMRSKAFAMSVHDIRLFSLAPVEGAPSVAFADPEWRGVLNGAADERRPRPLSDIQLQISRLATWIAAGGDYGWLGAYQSRRAAFELQSVRAQIVHETVRSGGGLADDDRSAIQSRLDRLEACLDAARARCGAG
jgi:hypothetical protein